MSLEPIKKNATLKEQAYSNIKQAIYSNSLKPGDALTEEQLSSSLSISRTPIRSALQQLVFEKLATTDTTGHIYVSTITEKDVSDITIMRQNLEPLSIDLIPFPLTEEQLTQLRNIHKEQLDLFKKDPTNNLRYSEIDTLFHSTIAQFTNNDLLYETVHKINSMMIRINVLSGNLNSHKKKALEEHEAIIRYLEAGQKSFAKLALAEHISNVSGRMFQ